MTSRAEKILIIVTCIISIFLGIIGAEWTLKEFHGLGNPLIYQKNPLYGYRPIPNQRIERKKGQQIIINNLGLRNSEDWDNNTANKVLVIGDSVTYGGSYIDNKDLFTSLMDNRLGYTSVGNAGVNGWGIGNMVGLIQKSDFQPASQYITVALEADFYRGLTDYNYGWFKKPSSAIQEVLFHYIEKRRHRIKLKSDSSPPEKDTDTFLEETVIALKEMETELNDNGYSHQLVISPRKAQLLKTEKRDLKLYDLFKKHDIHAIYLADISRVYSLDEEEINEIYHDHVHLTKKGHTLWAELLVILIRP